MDGSTSWTQRIRALPAILVAATLALTACEGGESLGDSPSLSGPGADQPTLTVRMTDRPGDLDAAWIRVTDVLLAESEGGQDPADGGNGDADGNGEDGGPLELDVETPDELIPLTPDGITELVEEAPVEPGVYGQLRLVIDGGVVKDTDGDFWSFGDVGLPEGESGDVVGTLKCPSCTRSGVKVNLPDGGLEIDEESVVLMLDFNVSESFGHQAGRSGKFIMRPVITSSVLEVSGDIAGTVTAGDGVEIPECGGAARSVEDFTPQAMFVGDGESSQTAEVTATDDAGTEGEYEMDFLQPGDWEMGFVAETEFEVDGGTETLLFEADVTPATVTVESGATATADYIITAASCDVPSDDSGGSDGDSGSGS